MFYSVMKEKMKVYYREKCYFERLFNSLINMFSYSTELPFEFIYNLESYLISDGECAIMKEGNTLEVWHGSRVGALDTYGMGKDLLCITNNGKSVTIKDFANSDKVLYVRNNYTSTPDYEVFRYSNFLADIDKSIKHNVVNCRVSPIIEVEDVNEKKEVENALSNNESGKPTTIITRRKDPLAEDKTGANVLSYTDVQNIDKVQYLTTLHENIERWFYSMYGLATSGSTKMAQQSVDEVNNEENKARILPDVKMEMRAAMCKAITEKWGIDISVQFNDAWKVERNEEREEVEELDSKDSMDSPDSVDGTDLVETEGSAVVGGSLPDLADAVVVEALEEVKEQIDDIEAYMDNTTINKEEKDGEDNEG